MDFSAVVTDLDGTFWSTAMTLHPATVDALAAFDAAGIPFVIATGRRALSTLAGASPLGLGNRGAVLMNGALVRDRLDGESFHREVIERDDALRALEVFAGHGLQPLVYIDHPEADVLAGPNASAGDEFLASAPGLRRVPDLDRAISEASVIGFGAFGYPKDQLEEAQAEIVEAGIASAIISPSHYEGDHGIMLQGEGVDKATGLDAYCTRHGLDRTRLVAIGDGFNDIGMLKSAAMAVVPTNAPDAIQELADASIAPNEEGGWAQLPRLLEL